MERKFEEKKLKNEEKNSEKSEQIYLKNTYK